MNYSISIYCNDRKSYSLEDFKLKKDELHLEPIGIHVKTDIDDCIISLDEWEAPWCKAKNCDELIGPQLTESQALQITSGYDSTKAIVDKLPEGSAAKLCWNYNKGGLQWHLPDIEELCLIYTCRGEINIVLMELQELGYKVTGIRWGAYWSSSEYNNLSAWFANLYDGSAGYWGNKNSQAYVRAFACREIEKH